MTLPGAVETLVLVLGTYRLLRFAGWDEWPPIARARARLIGEHWVPTCPEDPEPPSLPGKQPSSEVSDVRPAYRRPTLAHLIHCPFCIGFWISLAVYGAWLATPAWTVYVLAPFALSGAIGLIAKVLDP